MKYPVSIIQTELATGKNRENIKDAFLFSNKRNERQNDSKMTWADKPSMLIHYRCFRTSIQNFDCF